MVSSLMINYLALYFGNYMLNNVIGDPKASAASYPLSDASQLPVLIQGTRVHFGLIIAIAVAILGYIFLYRTKMGYELRLTGENEEFARYSGISIVKVIIISQLLGGFVAGLGGGVEMLSPIYSRFTWTSLLGYGWDAIIICTLAKKNPLYTPFAALFLAYLRTGASIMARRTDVTLEIVQITQGIIILFVVAEQFLSKYKHKMIAKEAKAALKEEEVA
jgi:simple sugar transport system permease protein